ncbi:MAG: hypothetical protein ACKO2P_03150 [Planctomycetota bacterium]
MTGPRRITIECTACGVRLAAAETTIGRTVNCSKCGAPIAVQTPGREENTESWIRDTIAGNEPMFVVRYAPDVISDPMSASELADHLRTGRLPPDLLFAEVGSTGWKPLTFIAPIKPKAQPAGNTPPVRIHKAEYAVPGLVILLGLGICLVSVFSQNPVVGVLALICLLFGWNWLIYTWVNTFFLNVQALLWKLAHTNDN